MVSPWYLPIIQVHPYHLNHIVAVACLSLLPSSSVGKQEVINYFFQKFYVFGLIIFISWSKGSRRICTDSNNWCRLIVVALGCFLEFLLCRWLYTSRGWEKVDYTR